jgi:hypothetical protein
VIPSKTLAYIIQSLVGHDVDVGIADDWEDIGFTLREPGPWSIVIDTGHISPDDIGASLPIVAPDIGPLPHAVGSCPTVAEFEYRLRAKLGLIGKAGSPRRSVVAWRVKTVPAAFSTTASL